jgi:SAM-dependent methyltransferase
MQELFDKPEEYEAMLQKGIALTGNDRHFFIHGRFDFMLSRSCMKENPGKILDFGCGTGDATAELARRYPDAIIYGYDPAVKAMDFARNEHQMARLHFVDDSDLKRMQFDLIFLNCVLHHILPENRQETIQLLSGLLQSEGQLWIFENNPANPGTCWAMYRNPFDKGVVKIWPGELSKMLRKAGLEIKDRGFLFFFPQWLSFFRPLEKFLTSFPLGGQYALMAENPRSKTCRD